jgi:glycosyltransferase involved in cell wall biosynthesis
VADLLSYFDKNGVPEGLRFYFRGTLPEKFENLRGVEFIADDVSDDIYWSNLVNADVVIIPYLSPCFTYRTSGILVDALVSGVPCVVLNNTWLADVVQSTRAGLIVKYYSPHTIISAIKIVLANREFFLRVLDVGGRRYLLENSWKKVAEFARV